MNIQVPYKWIIEYLKTKHSAKELAELLPLHGPQVETVEFNDQLKDEVLDIEITPNRIDTASVTGIAREAGAITKEPFELPEPNITIPESDQVDISIEIKDFERCLRFHALVIDGVEVKESPEWMKRKLEALGHKAINNLVDISNYVLLEYGYPTHIFDYNRISGNEIIIRRAKDGEKFVTLDGEKKKLTVEDLVIADSEKAISLAGVKGGINSGVSPDTTTIVIEAANFEPYAIRKTARRHELHTDAASLFEKGLSPLSATTAIKRVAELVLEIAGGEIVSTLQDAKDSEFKPKVINFDINEIPRLLGVEIAMHEVVDILERLDFKCKKIDAVTLEVTVPHFRSEDVEFGYDLVEEVARIYGYENIPSRMLSGDIPEIASDESIEWENNIKDILAGAGLTEQFSRSMIGDAELEIMKLEPKDVLELANPLSMEYKYMRTELISTMLMTAKNNEDYEGQLQLFELNMVYLPIENDLPHEQATLAIMINGNNPQELFLEAKGYFEHILNTHNINVRSVAFEHQEDIVPFENGATASISIDSQQLGHIGIISNTVKQKLGLKKDVVILQINFEALQDIVMAATKSYEPNPKYPAVLRDFAFIVDQDVAWSDIESLAYSSDELVTQVKLFDVYQGKGIEDGKKSVAFSVQFQSEDKTLSDEEVEEKVQTLVDSIAKQLNAELRS